MGAIKMMILFALLILPCFSHGLAFAEDYIHVPVHYYDITPGLTIAKSVFSISRDFTLETDVSLRFTVDHVKTDVSGVDAVSGASQFGGTSTKGTDTRKEIAGGVTHTAGSWKIEPGYVLSVEKDYKSQVPAISVSRDLFQRNTTITVGYAHNFDEIMGSYMAVSENKDVSNYAVSLTQVLTPEMIAQIGYTFSDGSGYMGTGNRQVRLENDQEMDEYLPEERGREAVGFRIAQWLPTNGSVHFSYRYYTDDWQIDSNTWQVQINQYVTDAILLRGEYRYYDQNGAYFVKDSYTGAEKYLTSASSLRAFNADLYGVKLIFAIKGEIDRDRDWNLEAKYERYTQSNDLEANIFMLGIRVPL